MKKNKISIIMPVYNSGKYLESAVRSVLKQTFEDFELILVDDGSTDESPKQCDYFAKIDSRVVVIHQKNGGICNARNAGLKMAKGDYIGFCDHDDEFLPTFLENAYLTAKETDADVVKVSKNVYVTIGDRLIKERSNLLPNQIWNVDDIRSNFFLLFNYYDKNCVWDGLFKRKIFDEGGVKFDEYYKYGGEDYDLTAQYLPLISKLVTMEKRLYTHYVRFGVSTSSKFKEEKFFHIMYLNKKIYQISKKIGLDFDTKLDVYNYFLTDFYLNPATSVLCNPRCDYTFKKKKEMVNSLWSEEFMDKYFGKASVFSVAKFSKKNGLAYFLAKYRLTTLFILMHRLRIKQQTNM